MGLSENTDFFTITTRHFSVNNMTLFQKKYRVESARLQCRDYTENGWYFITICTKNRDCVFGEIRNGIIGLSDIGNVVANCWQKIEYIRCYVTLDEWIVMPNHIHGIIRIERNDVIDAIMDSVVNDVIETSQWDVSITPLTTTNTVRQWCIPMTTEPTTPRLHANSIGSIMGQFKSVCTKRIHSMGYDDFAWQTRFYDHIIRDTKSLNRIREYIRNNPHKWEHDRNNPEF